MQTISEFIARKLTLLNEHPPIQSANKDGVAKVRESIERHNARISNKIGFENYDLTPEELNELKIKIPAAFKDKPVTYEATASHVFAGGELAGKTTFVIEVIN